MIDEAIEFGFVKPDYSDLREPAERLLQSSRLTWAERDHLERFLKSDDYVIHRVRQILQNHCGDIPA